jgi:hypothetical protein
MQGVSNLELICAELEALDELQEARKRIKKERKKQRKLNKQVVATSQSTTSATDPPHSSAQISVDKPLDPNPDVVEASDQNCVSCSNISNGQDEYEEVDGEGDGEEEDEEEDEENLDDNNNCLSNNEDSVECESEQKNTAEECNCSSNHGLFSSNSFFNTYTLNSNSGLFQFSDHSFNTNENEQVDSIGSNDDGLVLITDEEKNEYYANKTMYLIERINRREMLRQKFQNLKLANFKIRPRNVS